MCHLLKGRFATFGACRPPFKDCATKDRSLELKADAHRNTH
jgi:hypothetical protein